MTAIPRTDIMQSLAAHYGALRGTCDDLPELDLVVVHAETEAPVAAGAAPTKGAWARARELANKHKHAWVRRRSGVWASDAADDNGKLDDTEDGPPLWGEWASDDGRSVHLRPAGGGMFRFHRISEKSFSSAEQVQDGALVVLRQRICAIREGADAGRIKPVLLYHVYWGGTDSDPYGIRRLFSRFAGFAERDVRINP
jgi:hypothetical protein